MIARWLDELSALLPGLGADGIALQIQGLLTRSTIARDARELAQALALTEQAEALALQLDKGADSALRATVLQRRIVILSMRKQADLAERTSRQARAMWVRLRGPDYFEVTAIDSVLATQLLARGDLTAARFALEAVAARYAQIYGADSYSYANILVELSKVDQRQALFQAAQEKLQKAADIFSRTAGPQSMQRAVTLWQASGFEAQRDNSRRALELLQQALPMIQSSQAASASLLEILLDRAELEQQLGRFVEAAVDLQRARRLLTELPHTDPALSTRLGVLEQRQQSDTQ